MTEQVEVIEVVQPEIKLNLFQKIHAVMKDIEYLNKDDAIKFGNTSYKAISEEKVTSTVRASLLKHGLVIMPVEQEHSKEGNLTTVNTRYKIVDIDTGQYETIVSSGTGADTQDKGVGKAMTYSYKYLLLRTFAIPTGEDPDKVSSAELDAKEGKGNEPKRASDKQLDFVSNLINRKVKGKWTYDALYQSLKEKMGIESDMEKWTSDEAKRAIDILQSKGEKQGA